MGLGEDSDESRAALKELVNSLASFNVVFSEQEAFVVKLPVTVKQAGRGGNKGAPNEEAREELHQCRTIERPSGCLRLLLDQYVPSRFMPSASLPNRHLRCCHSYTITYRSNDLRLKPGVQCPLPDSDELSGNMSNPDMSEKSGSIIQFYITLAQHFLRHHADLFMTSADHAEWLKAQRARRDELHRWWETK